MHSRYYSQLTYSIVYPIIYAQFNHYDTVSFSRSLLHSHSLLTSIRLFVYSRTHGEKIGNTRLTANTRIFCMRIKRNLFKNSIAFFFQKKKCTPSDAQSAVAGSAAAIVVVVGWSGLTLLLFFYCCCWWRWWCWWWVFFFGLFCFCCVLVQFAGIMHTQTYTGKKWVKITNQIEWKSNTLNKLHRFEVLFQHFNLGRKLRYKIHLTQ